MRTLLLLSVLAVVLGAPSLDGRNQPRFSALKSRTSTCTLNTDVNSCIAGNDFDHPQLDSKHISCLWCHSHDDTSKPSHCTSLDTIRGNHRYHAGWVCDYHTPLTSHYKKHHGLSVEPVTEDPYGAKMNMPKPKPSPNTPKMNTPKGKDASTGMHKEMGAPTVSDTVKDFVANAPKPVQFLGGLAMGVLGSIPFSPTKIIAGVDSVQTDINNLMSKFSISSTGAVANDVTMVANTIKDMAGLLQAAGAPQIAEKAAAVVAKADNPLGWVIGAGELALNGVNVYQDFNAAIKAYQSGDNFELGKRIGDIISILAE